MKKKVPLRNRCKFYFESFFERFPRQGNFVINYILVFVVFNALGALLVTYSRELHIWVRPTGMGMVAGAVYSILAVFVLKYVRDENVKVIHELKLERRLPSKVEDLVIKVFRSKYQIYAMIFAGLFGLLYNIYLLNFGIWEYSFLWWIHKTLYDVFFYYPVEALLLFFCGGTILIVNSTGKNIAIREQDFFHPDKIAGLKALGNLNLLVILSWSVVGIFFVPFFFGSSLNSLVLLSSAVYGIMHACILVILFILSLQSLHKPLKNQKHLLMLKLGKKIIGAKTKLEQKTRTELDGAYSDLLRRKIILEQTEKVKEWPFDMSIFIKAVASAFIPILTYLLTIILETFL